MEKEHIKVGQLEVIFLAAKDDTGGHADVFELRVPPGARVPGAHHHTGMDEVITGLEGQLTYVVGDRVFEVGPGDHAVSPRGIRHYFVNRSDRMARALVVGTPATLGPEYFREVAAAAAAAGPPDMQKIVAVMRKYGLEPQPLPAGFGG
jgi:quercetin dioxygenase-like cupin family protein